MQLVSQWHNKIARQVARKNCLVQQHQFTVKWTQGIIQPVAEIWSQTENKTIKLFILFFFLELTDKTFFAICPYSHFRPFISYMA